jgi:hypothetical protein
MAAGWRRLFARVISWRSSLLTTRENRQIEDVLRLAVVTGTSRAPARAMYLINIEPESAPGSANVNGLHIGRSGRNCGSHQCHPPARRGESEGCTSATHPRKEARNVTWNGDHSDSALADCGANRIPGTYGIWPTSETSSQY